MSCKKLLKERKTAFGRQVQYWAHMLDESFNTKEPIVYTGKLDGYKWLFYDVSNITETQCLYSFDSEADAIGFALSYLDEGFEPDDLPYYTDATMKVPLNTEEEVYDCLKQNKTVSNSDGSSFVTTLKIIRIKASDMPKVFELVNAGIADYDNQPDGGSNIRADGLYNFVDFDKIEAMKA